MPKVSLDRYSSPEDYGAVLITTHAVVGLVLLEFAREEREAKDTILRNFLARSDTISRAIFALWGMYDFHDCWVLHRCLLDRLFHLYYLDESSSFDVFEDWSFLRQYEAVQHLIADPEFGGPETRAAFEPREEQKARTRKLQRNRPRWRRPRAEEVAKAMDMEFLYRLGYNFASSHVHPMANDGDQDFYIITGVEPACSFRNHVSVLSNTLLVLTMISQHCMSSSSLGWRAVVFNFFEEVRLFLGTEDEKYKLSYAKIGQLLDAEIPLSKEP
jgi:hypothetical protein